MKHLKLFESYYKDLTPYEYDNAGRQGLHGKCLNIGWIGKDNFEKGEVSESFLRKLIDVENSDAYTIARHKGSHTCEICGQRLGSSVKKIGPKEKYYTFPSKTSHYVESHNYKPPQEFIDTIMDIKIPEAKPKSRNSGFNFPSF